MPRTATTRAATGLAALLPALALTLSPVAPASASAGPDTIDLKTGSLPEGITTGPGDTFFAGARKDGAVRQYSTTSGALLRTVVAPRDGAVAVGLLYDADTGRLFVAGGTTGELTVYDAATGAVLFAADAGDGRFLNDVTVTKDAAYFTDSSRAELIVVPFGKKGSLPTSGRFEVLTVHGDYVQPRGFGLNGIRDLPGGDLVVVSGGVLYRVDPRSGTADRLEQAGAALVGGDGLELVGRTLYVVNGYGGNEVVVLRLEQGFSSTSVTTVLDEQDTTSELDRPTTGALVGGDLYVVNGRFGTVGSTDGSTVPFTVSRLDLT
ncbi:MAG: superoxide dismutase [Pseudorhodobacter sp.]|nr:superoxide dismutase [Frankiaceae bacterium]